MKKAQDSIPSNLKTEYKTNNKVPILPYKFAKNVNVLSPLADKDHADPVFVLEKSP